MIQWKLTQHWLHNIYRAYSNSRVDVLPTKCWSSQLKLVLLSAVSVDFRCGIYRGRDSGYGRSSSTSQCVCSTLVCMVFAVWVCTCASLHCHMHAHSLFDSPLLPHHVDCAGTNVVCDTLNFLDYHISLHWKVALTPIMQLNVALFCTSNGIMELRNTVLASSTQWAGFSWTTLTSSYIYSATKAH